LHPGFRRGVPAGRPKETTRLNERGFTLVELAIVVAIFGLILSIAVLSYSNISRSVNMNGASKQIEAAMNRAKTAARQENVRYQLVFYANSAGVNANSYEFIHDVYNEGTDTWTMTPVDGSISGEEVNVDGSHFYIKVGNGVKIDGCDEISGNQIVVNFAPAGTTMAISGSDSLEGPGTTSEVTLNLLSGGNAASVSINSIGMITKN
jgi:prepilin-type N-terminal cleavage/methylation domain-containing protein